MKCPHCLTAFHSNEESKNIEEDKTYYWNVIYEICPTCEREIIHLYRSPIGISGGGEKILVYPKSTSRSPLPAEVPKIFSDDYVEACLVLNDSSKASAALSRRCLQNLLREKAGIKKGNLYDEIQEVLDSNQLPSYLAESIDGVRSIGNFAAHPVKSTNTGEIIEVEPGEAEWLLDVLEGLFDFYFVQPGKLKEKRDKLNEKLKDAGKPPIK